MNGPTASGLAKLFSQLTGRSVRFALASNVRSTKARILYGVYTLPPSQNLMVVWADRLVIGQFGGMLLGLPPASIAERVEEYETDTMLCDAMLEVMNIASSQVSPGQLAVLKGMFSSAGQLDPSQRSILDSSNCAHFEVTIDEAPVGHFAVLSQETLYV